MYRIIQLGVLSNEMVIGRYVGENLLFIRDAFKSEKEAKAKMHDMSVDGLLESERAYFVVFVEES